MTKKELKEALDEKGINYEDNASNDELEALLNEAPVEPTKPVEPQEPAAPVEPTAPVNTISEPPKPVSTEPTEIGGDVHPTYGKLTPFQWAYLKQNPEKFALKFGRGEVPATAPINPLVSKLKK